MCQTIPFPTENARWCYTAYDDFGQDLGLHCFEPEDSVKINSKYYTRTQLINLYGGTVYEKRSNIPAKQMKIYNQWPGSVYFLRVWSSSGNKYLIDTLRIVMRKQ